MKRDLLAVGAASLACVLAFGASGAGAAETPVVTRYPLAAKPTALAQGPHGEVWFAEGSNGPYVGYVPQSSPSTESTKTFEVVLPNNGVVPEAAQGIVAGSADTLWFAIPDLADAGMRKVEDPGLGEIDVSGASPSIKEWAMPHEGAQGTRITALATGPSATIWYADAANDELEWLPQVAPEQVKPVELAGAGVLTEPAAITQSPDGSIWVEMDGSETTHDSGGLVHVVNPTSATPAITEDLFPSEGEANDFGRLAGTSIAVDCAGEVWVSGGADGVVDELDPTSSTVRTFKPVGEQQHAGLPESIALAPNQSVWYDENEVPPTNGAGIVNLLPGSPEPFSYLSIFSEPGVDVGGMITGGDGNLWLGEQDGIAKVTLPPALKQAPATCTGGSSTPGGGNGGGEGSTSGNGSQSGPGQGASVASTTTQGSASTADRAQQDSLNALIHRLLSDLSHTTIAKLLAHNEGISVEVPTSYGGTFALLAVFNGQESGARASRGGPRKSVKVLVMDVSQRIPAASKGARVRIGVTRAGRKLLKRDLAHHRSVPLHFTLAFKAPGHATAHGVFAARLKPGRAH